MEESIPLPIRVLLVDDSPVARALIKRSLAGQTEIRVVGSVGNGKEALALIPELDPDVILTDLHMPVMDGLEFTHAVMERYPRPILVISISTRDGDKGNVFQMFQAGAVDVLPKPMAAWLAEDQTTAANELATKIKTLARVNCFLCRSPTERLSARPSQTRMPDQPAPAVNMVVIGGAMGAPQPLGEILDELPADFPAPIICVQQIDNAFHDELIAWLRQRSAMPVHFATHGEIPFPGSIYLPPPDTHLTLDGRGRMVISHAAPADGVRPSITVTMESVASRMGSACIGVLLSGVGSDGVRGMDAIVNAGGITIAQDEESCQLFDLPRQAIELGAASHILPCGVIAKALLTLTGYGAKQAIAQTLPAVAANGHEILVVEDSPTQALKLKKTLLGAGFEVTVARDGMEGVERLRAHRPHLVVSDVSMPRMDGFTLCRTIKRDSELRTLPVILLTALTNPNEILDGLDAGADNYLTKPYDPDYLITRIHELLEHPPAEETSRDEGLQVSFEGRHYRITSSRQQILNLLLSTYQKAVQQNRELTDSQLELKMLNLQLVEQSARQEELNRKLQAEIIERTKAEERQTQLLKELETVNKELSDFAYIVSHDLKAPVRAIGSLTNWLLNDHQERLDDGGKELLHTLAGRANRMSELVEAILQYTEVTRLKDELVTVNLNRLVEQIIAALEPLGEIEIRVVRPLPAIRFDLKRAGQVFRHLITNAVRFMGKPYGLVKIDWREDTEQWVFMISDTGPGIAERYFVKIFGIFQTLQARDQLETSGVGLALVKKIIEKYGGRVWVESEENKGSTFGFTILKRIE